MIICSICRGDEKDHVHDGEYSAKDVRLEDYSDASSDHDVGCTEP